MHNPFALLTPRLLKGMLASGNRFFVRQTYKRGMDELDDTLRGSFLMTHYADAQRAQNHYDALPFDGNRFLYDSQDAGHLQKLEIASRQPIGYKIFTPLLEKEWKPPARLADKIRRYTAACLHWKISRKDALRVELEMTNGELGVILTQGRDHIKVPLSDIEKF